jgi:hypothetical protein
VVANQPARKADQDWREDHEPRALCDLPDGRGRSVAANVRRHFVTDRPAAGTARTGMRGQRDQARRTTRGPVCLDAGNAVRVTGSVPSTAGFDRALLPATANWRCPNRSKARSSLQNRRDLANVGEFTFAVEPDEHGIFDGRELARKFIGSAYHLLVPYVSACADNPFSAMANGVIEVQIPWRHMGRHDDIARAINADRAWRAGGSSSAI